MNRYLWITIELNSSCGTREQALDIFERGRSIGDDVEWEEGWKDGKPYWMIRVYQLG